MPSNKTANNKTSNLINLRCGIPTDLVTIDPGLCDDIPGNAILSQCFEGLIKFDSKQKIVLNLADKITISADKKTYIFYIKKGVKFHNGDELTAKDFKWTLERNLNSFLGSLPAPSLLGNIIGVKAYREKNASEIIGIKVMEPYKLKIEIETPQPYFLYKFSFPSTYVLNHRIAPKTQILQLEDAVGTGPFKFVSHKDSFYSKFVKYLNYHGQIASIDVLEYFVISDPQMMINKVNKGLLDMVQLTVNMLDEFKQSTNSNSNDILRLCNNGVHYLEFNVNNPGLFQNSKFRRAIAHAIDRKEFIKTALAGYSSPSYYLIPPNVIGGRSDKGSISFDVDYAKQLLKEIKIPLNQITIKLTTSSKPVMKKVVENISVQLRRNLGINVEIQSLFWNNYIAKRTKGELPLRLDGWLLDYPDPSNILLTLFHSKKSRNYNKFNNKKFDALVEEADVINNSTKREILYQEAEDILIKDAYVIPLFSPHKCWWVNPKIKGLFCSNRDHLPYNTIYFK